MLVKIDGHNLSYDVIDGCHVITSEDETLKNLFVGSDSYAKAIDEAKIQMVDLLKENVR